MTPPDTFARRDLRALDHLLDEKTNTRRWEVWERRGAAFMARHDPGTQVTAAGLDRRPIPPGWGRVVVHAPNDAPAESSSSDEG